MRRDVDFRVSWDVPLRFKHLGRAKEEDESRSDSERVRSASQELGGRWTDACAPDPMKGEFSGVREFRFWHIRPAVAAAAGAGFRRLRRNWNAVWRAVVAVGGLY